MSVKNALAKRGLKQSVVIAGSITAGTAAIGLGVAIPTYLKIQHELKAQFSKVANLSGYMTQLMNKLGIPGDSAFQKELAGGYEVVFKDGKTQVYKNENGTKSLIMNTNPDGSISTAAQFDGPSASEMLQVLDVAQKTLGSESDTMNSILGQYTDIAADSSYAIEAQTSGFDEEVLRTRDKILTLPHYNKNPNTNFQSYHNLDSATQVAYQDVVREAADETNKASQKNIVVAFPGNGDTILSKAFDAIAQQQKMVEDAKAIASGQGSLDDLLKTQNEKINSVKDAVDQVTTKAKQTIGTANATASAKVTDAIVSSNSTNNGALLDVLVASTTRWIPPFAASWGYSDGGKLKNSSEILITGILSKLGLYSDREPENTNKVTGSELLKGIIKIMDFQKEKTSVSADESQREEILGNFKELKYANEMKFFPTQKITSISELVNNFADTTIADNNKVIIYKLNLQSYIDKSTSAAFIFANPYNAGASMALKNIAVISKDVFRSSSDFEDFSRTVPLLVNAIKSEIGENTKANGLAAINNLIVARDEIEQGTKSPTDFIKVISSAATDAAELEKMNNYIRSLSSAQSGKRSFLHGVLNDLTEEYFFHGANNFKFTWSNFKALLETIAADIDKVNVNNNAATNNNQTVVDWDIKKAKWITFLGAYIKNTPDKDAVFTKVKNNYAAWKNMPNFSQVISMASNYQPDPLRNILFTDNVNDFKDFYTLINDANNNFASDFLGLDLKKVFDIFGQLNPDHQSYLSSKPKVEANLTTIYSILKSQEWSASQDAIKALINKVVTDKKSLLIDDQFIFDFLKENAVHEATHEFLADDINKLSALYDKLANSLSSTITGQTLLQRLTANLAIFKTLSADKTWRPTGPQDFTSYFNTDDKIFEAWLSDKTNLEAWMKSQIRVAAIVASNGNVVITPTVQNQIDKINTTTASLSGLASLSPVVAESLQSKLLSLTIKGNVSASSLASITCFLTSANDGGVLSTDAKANELIAMLDETKIATNLPLIQKYTTVLSQDIPNADPKIHSALLSLLLLSQTQSTDFAKATDLLKAVNAAMPLDNQADAAKVAAFIDPSKISANLARVDSLNAAMTTNVPNAATELTNKVQGLLVGNDLPQADVDKVVNFLKTVNTFAPASDATEVQKYSALLDDKPIGNTTSFTEKLSYITQFTTEITTQPWANTATGDLKKQILETLASGQVSTNPVNNMYSFLQNYSSLVSLRDPNISAMFVSVLSPTEFKANTFDKIARFDNVMKFSNSGKSYSGASDDLKKTIMMLVISNKISMSDMQAVEDFLDKILFFINEKDATTAGQFATLFDLSSTATANTMITDIKKFNTYATANSKSINSSIVTNFLNNRIVP